MRGSNTGPRTRLLLPLLCLLLVAPSAQAQISTSPDFYGANVVPETGSVSLQFQGGANVPVTIEDVSGPSQSDQIPRERGRISFDVEVVGNDTSGWAASVSKTFVNTEPGDVHQVMLNIQSGATVEQTVVEVRFTATYETPTGEERVTNASVMAVVEAFPRVTALPSDYPDTFEPDDLKRVPITVTNEDLYPDMVSLRVDAPEHWMVSPPSSFRLAPGETKTVYVDIRSPDNPWFLFSTSSEYIPVDAVSENGGGVRATTGIPVQQSGVNFPAWAAPHALMLLLGAGLIVKRSRRRLDERGLERGKPSYPGLDPEHEAEFEAMKVEDPDQAEVVERRLEALYDQRKEAWREAYEQRQEAEEQLQQAYEERHQVLVEARESDGEPHPVEIERRRELLETKRRLLERKRDALDTDRPPDEAEPGDGSEGTTGTPS